MADKNLRDRANLVDELVRPRAGPGIVAAVVLAAEVFAAIIAWGASTLDRGSADPILVTVAVLAAAITGLSLVARTGENAEPGNRWLAAAWIVIAVLAGSMITELPLQRIGNPAGPGLDKALMIALLWTLMMAICVAGADLRPHAPVLPWVVLVAFLVAGTMAVMLLPDGSLLTPDGPTFGYGLVGGMTVICGVGSCAWWLSRWNERGGWALTWSGVGLVLLTVATMFHLTAPFGSDRGWAAATALILSALVVPGIGAAVAAIGLAGARNIARRELSNNLDKLDAGKAATDDALDASDPAAEMLDALDVRLGTVVTVANREPSGAIATAEFPGTGLGLDWWRAQAATVGLASKLEVVLAKRAIDVARRQRPDAWLMLPVAARALSEPLLDVLAGPRAGQLVAVVEGPPRQLPEVLSQLRARGINVGIRVGQLDPRSMALIRDQEPSLIVVPPELGGRVHLDQTAMGMVADIVDFGRETSTAVLCTGIDSPGALSALMELDVRYAAGSAVLSSVRPAAPGGASVAPAAMELIEAAGLREPGTPSRT